MGIQTRRGAVNKCKKAEKAFNPAKTLYFYTLKFQHGYHSGSALEND